MKIICIIPTLESGGAERILSTLANAWMGKGYNVTFLTYIEADDFFELDTRINRIPLKLSGGSVVNRICNHIYRVTRVRKILKQAQPDIVVSFLDIPNIISIMSSIGTNIPVIISERTDPEKYKCTFPFNFLRRIFYHFADCLVIQNNKQQLFFDTMIKNITVINNPAPLDKVCCDQDRFTSKVIVAAGRLGQEKGYDLLIKAFLKISAKYPEWNLKILGEGTERETLEKLISDQSLQSRVALPGRTTDVLTNLQQSGIFVLSSRFEGVPNAMLEALACECPVIATECNDAIRNLITDGENGLLVPTEDVDALADALDRLISDEELRQKFSDNSRGSIKHLHIDNILKQWDELFSEVLKK